MMDAAPLLVQVAGLLKKHGLEAVLIGNAAAVLQGAPVTTADIDFSDPEICRQLQKVESADRGPECNAVPAVPPVERLVSRLA
jgi:hypothetical protein